MKNGVSPLNKGFHCHETTVGHKTKFSFHTILDVCVNFPDTNGKILCTDRRHSHLQSLPVSLSPPETLEFARFPTAVPQVTEIKIHVHQYRCREFSFNNFIHVTGRFSWR